MLMVWIAIAAGSLCFWAAALNLYQLFFGYMTGDWFKVAEYTLFWAAFYMSAYNIASEV